MSKVRDMKRLRQRLQWLASTPLHPQWLLNRSQPTKALGRCRGTVLDIGSANRWLASKLHPEAHYIALDYPATATAMYGCRPDIFADAHHLPIADNSVDAVACFEVMEHLSDPDRALSEIRRVLKPGGMAVLSMPFLYPIHDAPYDFQRWTGHGWERSARSNGLQITTLQASNHALHASAVIANLALAVPAAEAKSPVRYLLMAALAPLILLVNLAAAVLARLWPSWEGLATSYQIHLYKPQ